MPRHVTPGPAPLIEGHDVDIFGMAQLTHYRPSSIRNRVQARTWPRMPFKAGGNKYYWTWDEAQACRQHFLDQRTPVQRHIKSRRPASQRLPLPDDPEPKAAA